MPWGPFPSYENQYEHNSILICYSVHAYYAFFNVYASLAFKLDWIWKVRVNALFCSVLWMNWNELKTVEKQVGLQFWSWFYLLKNSQLIIIISVYFSTLSFSFPETLLFLACTCIQPGPHHKKLDNKQVSFKSQCNNVKHVFKHYGTTCSYDKRKWTFFPFSCPCGSDAMLKYLKERRKVRDFYCWEQNNNFSITNSTLLLSYHFFALYGMERITFVFFSWTFSDSLFS